MGTMERLEASRQRVADAVARAMEEGGLSWQREWAGRWSPVNAVTGRPYRGINRVALAQAGSRLGTPDGRWLTFAQGRAAGWPVRRGERSPASIEFWSRWCRTSEGKVVAERRARELVRQGAEDEEILRSSRLAPVVTPAFSASQAEGVPEIPLADHSREDPAIADALRAASPCPVIEARSDEAFFSPADGVIVMPTRGQFKTLSGYARVLAHEMGHATAPALGRDVSRYAADPRARAEEELTAELASAFVCSDLGVDGGAADADDGMVSRALRNHAAYVASWAALVRDDPGALARAAREASRAADDIELRLPAGMLAAGGKGGAAMDGDERESLREESEARKHDEDARLHREASRRESDQARDAARRAAAARARAAQAARQPGA